MYDQLMLQYSRTLMPSGQWPLAPGARWHQCPTVLQNQLMIKKDWTLVPSGQWRLSPGVRWSAPGVRWLAPGARWSAPGVAVAQTWLAARGGCGYWRSLAPGVAAAPVVLIQASISDFGCLYLKIFLFTQQNEKCSQSYFSQLNPLEKKHFWKLVPL